MFRLDSSVATVKDAPEARPATCTSILISEAE
jgi:hypothetical protein